MAVFEKEILEIARIIKGIQRNSEENRVELDKQLQKIEEIFGLFNDKYKLLSFNLNKTIDSVNVKIFINEKSVKSVFDNASKIKGLTGIGINGFDEANVQEADNFSNMASGIKEKAFLTYTLDIGTETLVLQFNQNSQKVELIYELESLANPLAPQFQLLENYASNPDSKIEILKKCYELGFIDKEDEAYFKWEDEFYPKMLD